MAVIDPAGLYRGERLRACSNEARLYWPYLYLLANTLGRFEIDLDRIIADAFGTFNPLPSRELVLHCLSEYRRNFLLFVYESEGHVWGQWDSKEGSLPDHKYKRDLQTPKPPEDKFNEWKQQYVESKRVVLNSLEDSGKFPIGKGIGLGIGLGVNIPSPGAGEDVSSPSPLLFSTTPGALPSTESPRQAKTVPAQRSGYGADEAKRWFDEEFWPIYWRKVDKADALKAFRKHAKNAELKARILTAVKVQKPLYEHRDPEHRPHAATWLNKRRYDDPPEEYNPSVEQQQKTKAREVRII